MAKINVLPKIVQNIIASGQVISNPASVIKELVENSLDAGAGNISIYVKDFGLESMVVVDDGCGIAHEEIDTAFKAHATSKISHVEDISEIKTMGFRGEALPAIASISRVNIWTKTLNEDVGTMVSYVYGEKDSMEYCASGTQGTKIEVRSLFGNAPNKARFLKRPSAELSDITNVVTRLMFANPYVSFKYFVDDNIVFSTEGKGLDEAVVAVYGRECLEKCFRIDSTYGEVTVTGLVGESDYVKYNSSYQTVIVNGRYVKDDTVSAAVKKAFDGLLMTREYPFFILNVDLPADKIDVNIHPTKMEVKFSNKHDVFCAVNVPIKKHFEKQRYEVASKTVLDENNIKDVSSAITDLYIETHYPMESVPDEPDEERVVGDINFENLTQLKISPRPSQEAHNNFKPVADYQLHTEYAELFKEKEEKIENNFYYQTMDNNFSDNKNASSNTSDFHLVDSLPKELSEEDMAELKVVGDDGSDATFSTSKIIGVIFNNYILAQNKKNTAILLIDQHAAHERILFDKYMSDINSGPVHQQTLLFPTEFSVTPEQIEFLEMVKPKMHAYGFDYEITERDILSVTAIPYYFSKIDLAYFFNSLFEENQHNFDMKNINKAYLARKACKSAIRGGMTITELDIKYIFKRLYENHNLKCPHGRPIAIAIKKVAFDRIFKRIL